MALEWLAQSSTNPSSSCSSNDVKLQPPPPIHPQTNQQPPPPIHPQTNQQPPPPIHPQTNQQPPPAIHPQTNQQPPPAIHPQAIYSQSNQMGKFSSVKMFVC